MMFVWENRGTFQSLLVILLALLAWWRGAAPERWCASVLTVMVAALWLYELAALPSSMQQRVDGYADIELLFLLIDTGALAVLAAVALRANRFYPLWMAGFQLTAVTTHLASGMLASRFAFAYAVLNIAPFYFMTGALTLGLLGHLRRRARLGPYPSWRGSSGLSPVLAPRVPPPR